MYKRILRWLDMILHWFLVYILIVGWLVLCMWQFCIWQSVDAIRANPGFSERLHAYAELAERWKTLTDSITVIEPLITTTEYFKANDLLSKVVNFVDVAPVAGTVIQILDASASKAVEVKNQLLSLSRLASSAATVEQYLIEPTQHSQRVLNDAFADNMTEINKLVADLETVAGLINSVTGSLRIITNWLDGARANNSVIADLLYQTVAPLESRSRNFTDVLAEFRTNFATDSVTINRIVKNTQRVEWLQSMLAPGPVRPVVDIIIEHMLLTVFSVVVYLRLRKVISERC